MRRHKERSAIANAQFEFELWGVERGAFVGASASRRERL
jgi:transcriptional regulator with GAF, ATPase, and Fis domain